jgi:hypothetical protein
LIYTPSSQVSWQLNPDGVQVYIAEANTSLERIHDLSLLYGVEILELLGMRNLSAFVGQVVVKVFKRYHPLELLGPVNTIGRNVV